MSQVSQEAVDAFEAMERAPSCLLITFESASIHPGIAGDFFLTVAGEKPYLNMQVRLQPVVYIRQPEYWLWHVVGCAEGVLLPAVAPYHETRALAGAIGTKGIVVAGANGKSEQFDLR